MGIVKLPVSIGLYLGVLFSVNLSAQQTEVQYLSGTDKDNTVTWDFFCTAGMNSGKWSTIQVPSNWEMQGFGAYNYGQADTFHNEQGLYRHRFNVPGHWQKGKQVYIVFEGSMTDTEVKINGKLAGPVHQGAFYRFTYNISSLLNYTQGNLLEVTVNKESSNPSLNRAERRADYWLFGGIFRPVYLEAFPDQYINHVAIDAKADGSFLMNIRKYGEHLNNTIEAQLQTTDGKPFGQPLKAAFIPGSNIIQLKGLFNNPKLWSPEFPNMYQVVITLKNGQKKLHEKKQKFGFRTVEVQLGKGVFVNGKKIMLRGVCRHTFWPLSGRCSSKELSITDVNNIKDMNMNAVRMSHYPPDQHFLDVCDSLGLFVLNELAGWQNYYDTETGKRLVKAMVERDVNHPSIIMWDNGNEGGFNRELRNEYALYDPQQRVVIEPWAKLNGFDTKHYPKYRYVVNALDTGNHIFLPTEFLHGLFDGGHGSGLNDYWNLMLTKPLAAGGFLWVYADEGIVRKDKKDSVDTHGNQAPDGILGPFHEKEGSYFTIRDIWSPVQFLPVEVSAGFDGKFTVINRFLYTNFNQCRFSYELVKLPKTLKDSVLLKTKGNIQPTSIAAGDSGRLDIGTLPNLKDYDVLYITATDPHGRLINTWSWNITKPEIFAAAIVTATNDKITVTEQDTLLMIASGITKVTFNKHTGLLNEVWRNNRRLSLNNGPIFAGTQVTLKDFKHSTSGQNHTISITFTNNSNQQWTMLPGGWLQLDYSYMPVGKTDFAGISFSYPEELVKGATLVANGPYHVWKNRLRGPQFGVFKKKYNNTVTGESWDYPEFKGYYSNFYAVEIQTSEMPFTIVSATEDLFLHMFTPQGPKYAAGGSKFAKGGTTPAFPSGNLSVLHGISAIGTKFSMAEEEGPEGLKNDYGENGKQLKGRLYFRFGE